MFRVKRGTFVSILIDHLNCLTANSFLAHTAVKYDLVYIKIIIITHCKANISKVLT